MSKKKLKAFTLLELIIVLVILSILIAIAIPAIGKFQDSAKIKAIEMNKLAIKEAATLYLIDNNWDENLSNNIKVADLVEKKYLDQSGLKPGDYSIEVKNGVVGVKHVNDTQNNTNISQ